MENSKSTTSSVLINSEAEKSSSLSFDFSDPVNIKMQAINPSQQFGLKNSPSVSQMGLNKLLEMQNSSSLNQLSLKELFGLYPEGDVDNNHVHMNQQFASNNSLGFGSETSMNSYQLRWNDHIPYFTNILQGLREQNELTDVTFACEDGIVVAHKLVLSSCSAYLRVLFTRLCTPHPVIFLKNTPSSVVRQLMEFVYCGSVDVSEKDLVEVMTLGKSLQIQGLEKFQVPEEDVSNEINISCRVSDDGSPTTEVRSESPFPPGDVKDPPDYLFNGKNIEYDAVNNNIKKPDLKREVESTSPKTSIEHKYKNITPKIKPNQKRKRVSEKGGNNYNNIIKKSFKEVLEENGTCESKAMYLSDKGRLCYTPFIKKTVGKYYQEHGPHKSSKFVKEEFGMEIPDRTMRKWRAFYIDLEKKIEIE